MMFLTAAPTAAGQYFLRRIECAHPPAEFFLWPDGLSREIFDQYEGFVTPEVSRGAVIRCTANKDAYEAWKAAQMPPAPTDTEVLNALLGVDK